MTTKPDMASQYGTFREPEEPKPKATALSEKRLDFYAMEPGGQYDELLEEVDRLRAENASLTARVEEHLVMFKSNDETFKKLRAENGELRERIDELHDEKGRANRAVDNLSAENASLRDRMADEYKAACESFCELQNVLRVTTENLKKEIAENASLITALETDNKRIAELQVENERLKRTIDHIDPHGPSPDYGPLRAENARQAETIKNLEAAAVRSRQALNEYAELAYAVGYAHVADHCPIVPGPIELNLNEVSRLKRLETEQAETIAKLRAVAESAAMELSKRGFPTAAKRIREALKESQ